jgi:hypothetical protein
MHNADEMVDTEGCLFFFLGLERVRSGRGREDRVARQGPSQGYFLSISGMAVGKKTKPKKAEAEWGTGPVAWRNPR